MTGDQHRIDDQWRQPVVDDRACDGLDHRGRAQHPCLGRAHPEVADHGVDLGPDQGRRQHYGVVDTKRVLSGHAREGAGAPHAERLERLEVGLDAGPASRVRAGDGEGDRRPRLGDPAWPSWAHH